MTDYRLSTDQLNQLTVEQLIELKILHPSVAKTVVPMEGVPPYQYFWSIGAVSAGSSAIDWPRLIKDAYRLSDGSPVGWAMKVTGGMIDPKEFNRRYNEWFEKTKQ